MRRVVAIVEDDPAEADILRSHFARYAPDAGEEFDIRWFQSGDAFLDGYQPIYDLVMMDIDLPGISVKDTAANVSYTIRAVGSVRGA